jgi:alginate O-acetyltransferase complex protein AlgI
MEIISWQFASFFLVSLVVYHLLPRRGQNVWLLVCSVYFAASWKIIYAVVLVISILVNFGTGLLVNKESNSSKRWLIAGILINSAGLVFFRFAGNDVIELLLRYLSGGTTLTTQILIPIGFSFYTLQAISYLVDVYQHHLQPENDLVDFAVFLAYFPHLLSGPIERGKTFLPQLKETRIVHNSDLAEGAWLILLGLFRKLVIASLLFTLMPEGIFPRPAEFAVTDRWLAILVYCFWLYNDFAGYTAIVRGVSLFFGIRLSPNFRQPFFSRSLLEFWGRWHISLSLWLRDYIFFPVQRFLLRKGFQSRSVIRTVLPPLITMTVSGLWHNATIALVAWGLLHGTYQAFDHVASQKPGYVTPQNLPFWQQAALAIKVYLLLLPTWILFASGGLKLAANFAVSLFAASGTLRLRPSELIIPLIGLLLSFSLDGLQEKYHEEKAILLLPKIIQSGCIAFAILCVLLSMLWSNVPSAAFLYQGF